MADTLKAAVPGCRGVLAVQLKSMISSFVVSLCSIGQADVRANVYVRFVFQYDK
mgnify:CR=1 FL=1